MAGKSLNRVQLIGNLTKDPELRYTPTGAAVCSFGLATNRSWITDTGEKREEVEYHRLVAWRKLAEICSQYLIKGKKIYAEGHLTTRKWTAADGQEKSTTEIIMDDMIMLDSKRGGDEDAGSARQSQARDNNGGSEPVKAKPANKPSASKKAEEPGDEPSTVSTGSSGEPTGESVSPDDIPF